MTEVMQGTVPHCVPRRAAKRHKRQARKTPQIPPTGAFRPTAAHRRMLHAGLELLARSGWPTASAIALAVGRDRSTVAEHFRSPRFDAWFNSECDRFLASARSKAGAKFAALAMAGSVPHFEALGWSEAKRGSVSTVKADGSVDVSRDDGPATIVIQSMIPRPPRRLAGP